MAQPPLRKVYDDFKTLHPGITWDVRALPGGGPEWDRLARALLASGEPVDMVTMDGQQVRAWARDGLLAIFRPIRTTALLARVPASSRSLDPGHTSRR